MPLCTDIFSSIALRAASKQLPSLLQSHAVAAQQRNSTIDHELTFSLGSIG